MFQWDGPTHIHIKAALIGPSGLSKQTKTTTEPMKLGGCNSLNLIGPISSWEGALLGGVALLEWVWPCWKKYVTVDTDRL